MSLFLKLFNTTAEYNAYTADTENFILPNVSCTLDDLTTMHYNPIETRVVAKFNVTDTSSPTQIGYNQYISGFSAIEIDGVVQPSVVSAYTFSTTGEHTIKYTLRDQTIIEGFVFYQCTGLTSVVIPSGVERTGTYVFSDCSSLTSVTIPNSVTSIGRNIFSSCSSLTSIEIPSGVTTIGDYAFSMCSGLTSIVCNAATAPTIQSKTFLYVANTGGTLTVPIGSTGYDVWMGTGIYYLGYYNWTKVEQ